MCSENDVHIYAHEEALVHLRQPYVDDDASVSSNTHGDHLVLESMLSTLACDKLDAEPSWLQRRSGCGFECTLGFVCLVTSAFFLAGLLRSEGFLYSRFVRTHIVT